MHRWYLGRLKPEAEKRPRAQIIMKKVSQETEKRRKVLENDKMMQKKARIKMSKKREQENSGALVRTGIWSVYSLQAKLMTVLRQSVTVLASQA